MLSKGQLSLAKMSYWVSVCPEPMTGLLTRPDAHTHTHRGSVKMEEGTGLVLPQARDHQPVPATTRSRKRKGFFS